MRRESAFNEGVLAGIAALVSGFGAIYLLWHFGNWPRNVPGLWDYRSATIGDGILLPLMIGILAAAGLRSDKNDRHRKMIWGAVILAMIIGAGIQLTWLLDPDPRLNWGVPSPGHFSPAGTYHAVFFVLACGVISGLTVRMLIRLRMPQETNSAHLQNLLDSPSAARLIACSAGFVGLVFLDGQRLERYGPRSTVTSLSVTISAVAAMLLVAILVVSYLGTATPRPGRALPWGTALAGSLLLVAWRPGHFLGGLHSDELAVLVAFCTLFVFQLWVWRNKSAFWWVAAATAALIATAGAGFCLMTAPRDPVLVALVAVATWLLLRFVLIAPTVGRDLRQHLLLTRSGEDYIATILATSFLLPLSLLVLARWLDGGGIASWSEGATERAVGAGLAALGTLATWKYMKLYEQDISSGPGRKSDENAWAAYTTILVLFFSTLLGIFAVLHGSRSLINIDPQNAGVITDLPGVAAAGGIALAVAALGALAATPTHHTTGKEPSFRNVNVEPNQLVISLTAIALTLWACVPWMFLLAHHGVRFRSTIFPSAPWEVPFIVFALVISGWIGYTSADSIFANIAEIELMRLSHRAWLVTGAAGIATGSTASWVLVEGFFSTSAPARIGSLAFTTSIVAIGNLAILSTVALAFARSWPRGDKPFRYMALHHPATHVANDHFLQTGLLFVAVTTAYVGWLTLNWLSIPRTVGEAVTAFGAVALPFTVVSAFVAALTRGTDKHIASERERVERGKAKAIETRAGEDADKAQCLNNERLKKIEKRFNRAQIGSKILALYLPAAFIYLWHRFFPPSQTDPDDGSHHQARTA